MKKIVPHNIEEMSGNSVCQGSPGKHPGNTQEKVHLLMFRIKEASLAKFVGIFNKVKERERKLCPETPRKHLGNT